MRPHTIRDRDILIYSNCDSPNGRHHGTVWVSSCGGKTWPLKRLVHEGGFGYSSVTAGRPSTDCTTFWPAPVIKAAAQEQLPVTGVRHTIATCTHRSEAIPWQVGTRELSMDAEQWKRIEEVFQAWADEASLDRARVGQTLGRYRLTELVCGS